MPIIRGESNVAKALTELLTKKQATFMSDIKGEEGEYLFVLLKAFNYVFGLAEEVSEEFKFSTMNLTRYQVAVGWKALFDILLGAGVYEVESVRDDIFSKICSNLPKYFGISTLTYLLRIHNKWPLKVVRIENGEIDVLADKAPYEAMYPWIEKAGVDRDWIDWYRSQPAKHKRNAGKLLDEEFSRIYGLELNDLVSIDEVLRTFCEHHRQAITTKSPPSLRPWLANVEVDNLSKVFAHNMNEEKARKWIGLLEYRPGYNMRRCPLIKVRIHGKEVYVIPLWVFTPSDSFRDAWFTYLMETLPQSRAKDEWTSGQGKAYERYIDYKLKGINGVTNLGKIKCFATQYPQIKPWLEKLREFDNKRFKEGFEIDRLLIKGQVAFCVSCKSREFFYHSRLVSSLVSQDFLFPIGELIARVGHNLAAIEEVFLETSALASSQRTLEDLGLMGKLLIPIVVTSTIELLGVEQTRQFFAMSVPIQSVPVMNSSEFLDVLKGNEEQILCLPSIRIRP